MLHRVRDDLKHMNGRERGTCVGTAVMALAAVNIAVIGPAILIRVNAVLMILAAGIAFWQVRLSSRWRRLYESVRDRPRKENWPHN